MAPNPNTAQEDIEALQWVIDRFRESTMLDPITAVDALCLDDLEEDSQCPELKQWAAKTHRQLMVLATQMEGALDQCRRDTYHKLKARHKAQAQVDRMRTNAYLVHTIYHPKDSNGI